MSIEPLVSRRRIWSCLSVLLLMTVLPATANAIGWESHLRRTDYPRNQFIDTSLRDILESVLNHARDPVARSAPGDYTIVASHGVDLDLRLDLTVPAMAAHHAVAWIIRQAGYDSEWIGHDLYIFTRPDPAEGLHALESQMALRRLLFLSLRRDPADVEDVIYAYAETVLARSPVFRLGAGVRGFIPNEYAALVLLSRDAKAFAGRLARLQDTATDAGRFYLLAVARHLGQTPPLPDLSRRIPVIREDERYIVTESAELLLRDYIDNGAFLQRVHRSLDLDR